MAGDSVDQLSLVTGIPRADMLSIWDEVKANQARLDACARHDFQLPEPFKIGARYRCSVCDGWADGHAIHWYRKGLEHGGR